jgi:hypothetical protein
MLLFCTPMLFAGVHKDDANGDLPMKAAEPESSTQAERLVDQIAASVLSGEFQPGLISTRCSAQCPRARTSLKKPAV